MSKQTPTTSKLRAKSASRAKSPAKTTVKSKAPSVGIIMGSDSDLRVMEGAVEALEIFKIPFEIRVVSAHRTPQEMLDYASEAASRGLKVIIAGAGGAAHLPGMVASGTSLPVIGVPVNITALEGLDALLSVVQMPKGVPVATIGVDNAYNAGLLAVRMLATGHDTTLTAQLDVFREKQKLKVINANKKLKKRK